jgi:hypothetical protein
VIIALDGGICYAALANTSTSGAHQHTLETLPTVLIT